jgi:hypothetical protein
MPFLKLRWIASKLIFHLSPEIIEPLCLNKVAVLLDRQIVTDRHQLQRPEHNLPEMPDNEVTVERNPLAYVTRVR